MRDLNDYSKNYCALDFAPYMIAYRRKHLIERIRALVPSPKKILEIGCGMEPLFKFIDDAAFVVVEPTDAFFQNAAALAAGREDITLLHGLFEDACAQLPHDFDLIVCSSLLHEVEDPGGFAGRIASICSPHTIVDINVPNAFSFHRLLAWKSGMIPDVFEMSERNRILQQHSVFSLKSLKELLAGCGLETVSEGSYFIKPFTYAQMYAMLRQGILSEQVLDGLDAMTELLPDYGSEIFVQCRLLGA